MRDLSRPHRPGGRTHGRLMRPAAAGAGSQLTRTADAERRHNEAGQQYAQEKLRATYEG